MNINNLENQEEIIDNQEKNNINNNAIEEIINYSEHLSNNNISFKAEEKLSEYIEVFCRFRPPNESELSFSTNNSVILLSPKQLIITQEKKLELKKDYTFDGLFESDTSKEEFYQKTSQKIVNAVLKGYNGGIICYGETGTGKSYTLKEILPQVENQIFEYVDDADENNELFKIEVSIIEIYKEQVNDLID
jgi:Cdc6-like AAA superfamily ATPase